MAATNPEKLKELQVQLSKWNQEINAPVPQRKAEAAETVSVEETNKKAGNNKKAGGKANGQGGRQSSGQNKKQKATRLTTKMKPAEIHDV